MERGRLPAPEVRRLAAELVFTLGVLQQKRVIHGDIKPKNLLLDERGHLVLADFGMARCFATRRADLPWRGLEEAFVEADVLHPTDPEFERVDVTCRVVGTPVYAAPEVWWNERTPQSYPADVWSAGVVIFEMLFGRVSSLWACWVLGLVADGAMLASVRPAQHCRVGPSALPEHCTPRARVPRGA